MEDKGIIKDIIDTAKKNKKRIVLPEAMDLRVLRAADIISKDNIADIILIGSKEEIEKKCRDNGIENSNFDIEDNFNSSKLDIYANELFKIRSKKGMTLKMAYEVLKDSTYFATMMVNLGDADGMVSGACHSTADTLRPALQIIKAKENIKTVSSFFIMETQNKKLGLDGKYIFTDCGLVAFPSEDELVDIVIEANKSFINLLKAKPNVAMLSYSTKGSAKGENIDKLNNVVMKVRQIDSTINIDGELQLDAAIIKEVADLKAPNSLVAGKANLLVFPNLEAGNIGYKIAQRFGNMKAFGPITQGLNRPVNDLSRGCNIDDIIGVVAITCIQATKN